jgi:Tol biopolymer transport system component
MYTIRAADGRGLWRLTPYGLANSPDNGLAHWSPDGPKILFASAHGPCSPSGRMAPACEQSL